jgi:hypothetical protein
MKLYKSFGSMESDSTPSPSYSSYPPGYYGASSTPIEMLPDMMGGPHAANAIRNFGGGSQQQQYGPPPPMMGPPMVPQGPQQQLPSYADMMQLYANYPQMAPSEEPLCKRIAEHLKSCSKCSRKYVVDTNSYVAIIIGLVLFVLFLLTKIIDKFG